MSMSDLPHRELTEVIIGSFFEMANELGGGYRERVNQHALQVVLIEKGLKAERDVPVSVYFRGKRVGPFLADFVVNDTVICVNPRPNPRSRNGRG
jgi:GxxExxY protein